MNEFEFVYNVVTAILWFAAFLIAFHGWRRDRATRAEISAALGSRYVLSFEAIVDRALRLHRDVDVLEERLGKARQRVIELESAAKAKITFK